jgi:hypothetical protein
MVLAAAGAVQQQVHDGNVMVPAARGLCATGPWLQLRPAVLLAPVPSSCNICLLAKVPPTACQDGAEGMPAGFWLVDKLRAWVPSAAPVLPTQCEGDSMCPSNLLSLHLTLIVACCWEDLNRLLSAREKGQLRGVTTLCAAGGTTLCAAGAASAASAACCQHSGPCLAGHKRNLYNLSCQPVFVCVSGQK